MLSRGGPNGVNLFQNKEEQSEAQNVRVYNVCRDVRAGAEAIADWSQFVTAFVLERFEAEETAADAGELVL